MDDRELRLLNHLDERRDNRELDEETSRRMHIKAQLQRASRLKIITHEHLNPLRLLASLPNPYILTPMEEEMRLEDNLERYFLSGARKIRFGEYEDAERDFFIAAIIGQLLKNFENDVIEESISYVRRLRGLGERGDNPEWHFLSSEVKIDFGDYKGAEEDLTKAIEQQPDYKYYEARAMARRELKRYEEALKDITTAINRFSEKSLNMYLYIANLYYLRGIILLDIYNKGAGPFNDLKSEDISDRIRIAHNLRDGGFSTKPKTKKSDRPDHTYENYLKAGEVLLDLAVKDFEKIADLDAEAETTIENLNAESAETIRNLQAEIRRVTDESAKKIENIRRGLIILPNTHDVNEYNKYAQKERERLQLQSERCRSAVSPSTS